ncbi:hypothetical protein GQ53DRAFT_761076 [Thozetella sp. PMI_491]|nr:hypothetical protein GQ53DRAFT_761076 [Thozetella sp. PMI_491]
MKLIREAQTCSGINSGSFFEDTASIADREPKALAQELRQQFEVNAIGNVSLVNSFMPLILAGKGKTRISLSSSPPLKLIELGGKFAAYAPHFTRPVPAVAQALDVFNKASIEREYAGSFLSHLGTKQWL